MYVAPALARELERQQSRSQFHSIVMGGRDALGNVPFLLAALEQAKPRIPVMLDTDGQRPEALGALLPYLALVQVTVEFGGGDAALEHALATLKVAAQAKCGHALVLVARDDTPDSQILRMVEGAHGVSTLTQVVIHPAPPGPGLAQYAPTRRWATVLEHASAMRGDTRLSLRVPPPTGLR